MSRPSLIKIMYSHCRSFAHIIASPAYVCDGRYQDQTTTVTDIC